MNGISDGLFWSGYHILEIRSTEHTSREKFLGSLSSIQGTLGMLIPLISGGIIGFMGGISGSSLYGYYVLFVIGMFLYLVTVVYTYRVLPRVAINYISTTQLHDALNDPKIRSFFILEVIGNFSGTTKALLLTLFSFFILGSELNLGIFASLTGIANVMYTYSVGRHLNLHNRLSASLVGAVLMFVGQASFISFLSIMGVVLERVLLLVGVPLIGIATGAILLSSLEKISHHNKELEVEYLTVVEVARGVGRVLGILVLLIVLSLFGSQNITVLRYWFFVMSFSPILVWFLYARLQKKLALAR
jgi:hypothetical protein